MEIEIIKKKLTKAGIAFFAYREETGCTDSDLALTKDHSVHLQFSSDLEIPIVCKWDGKVLDQRECKTWVEMVGVIKEFLKP